jgi:hypothetical protein
MFESSYEIVGLILIIIGALIQIFGTGKGENAEFANKTFTLKGGPGIIFAGLGVALFITGAVQSPAIQATNTLSSKGIQPISEISDNRQTYSNQPIEQQTIAPPSTMTPDRWQTPSGQSTPQPSPTGK